MTLDCIKRSIRSGHFQEARRLIEKENDIYALMSDHDQSQTQSDYDSDNRGIDKLPLLVMLSLIKNEDYAVNLARILLEKGYHADICDRNGLCALNYAIALKRFKFLNLLLSSFDFELNNYRDCYKNSFLHYVYATNCNEIIQKFADIYSKYYEWDTNKFKNIVNRDGLSVQDLYDYTQYIKKREYLRKQANINRAATANTYDSNRAKLEASLNYRLPDSFKFDSNPIIICKYINQVYHSNSTMKFELLFVNNTTNCIDHSIDKEHVDKKPKNVTKQKLFKSSQANKEFKINILYQIKSLNKTSKLKGVAGPRLSSNTNEINGSDRVNLDHGILKNLNYSPISSVEHMPRILNSSSLYNRSYHDKLVGDEIDFHSFKFNNSSQFLNSSSWRSDFKQIFTDYTIVNSPSYRVSSGVLARQAANENQSLESNSKTNETSTTNQHNAKPNTTFVISRASSSCSQHDSKTKSPSHSGKMDIYLVPGSILNSKSKK